MDIKQWNPHPKLLKLIRDRRHYACDHCDRQYDDAICDNCFTKKIIREILKPALSQEMAVLLHALES